MSGEKVKVPFDGELTITKSDGFLTSDWWVLERVEHENRVWWKRTGPNSRAFCCSGRLEPEDADVEGMSYEWIQMASAIEEGRNVSFKRCAVHWAPWWRGSGEVVGLTSPRNSEGEGLVTKRCALRLAARIRAALG